MCCSTIKRCCSICWGEKWSNRGVPSISPARAWYKAQRCHLLQAPNMFFIPFLDLLCKICWVMFCQQSAMGKSKNKICELCRRLRVFKQRYWVHPVQWRKRCFCLHRKDPKWPNVCEKKSSYSWSYNLRPKWTVPLEFFWSGHLCRHLEPFSNAKERQALVVPIWVLIDSTRCMEVFFSVAQISHRTSGLTMAVSMLRMTVLDWDQCLCFLGIAGSATELHFAAISELVVKHRCFRSGKHWRTLVECFICLAHIMVKDVC